MPVVPASAEGSEQVDQGDLSLSAGFDQRQFIDETAALGVQISQVTVPLVSSPGQLRSLTAGTHQGASGRLFTAHGIGGGQ
ncbi:hypothetical protein D9M68_978450 [compost metagenome]